jgi:AraC-like DNA-binding protein
VIAHPTFDDGFRAYRSYRSRAFAPAVPFPVAAQIVDYIERNYASPISLRDVAKAFGYSSCHLTHAFARTTGTPITAWIIRRRIEAAKQLLSRGNTVAAAGEAVGFSDLCYFTRQFSRHVGTTPGRFRASKLENSSPPDGDNR